MVGSIDLTDLLVKLCLGLITASSVAFFTFVGKQVGWVFFQTKKNERDLDQAFMKIRYLEAHCGLKTGMEEQDNMGRCRNQSSSIHPTR